jgi:glycolate oxidase FAD binding subunit
MSVRDLLAPTSTDELCDALKAAADRGETMEIGGTFSKQTMGGPIAAEGVQITTTGMSRVLAYEPDDLTISVEAGMPWSELVRVVGENHQFIPVDPAFGETATVGGVVASDSSGPRRRRYGTARDVTIGMGFVTVEGKLIQSGGMVVKNVTGLDMAKLLIGSFGTLAAIATVNFKVLPQPVATRSFVFSSSDLAVVLKVRRRILASQLQPVALDLLSENDLYRLVAEAHGSEATVARYETDYKEFARAADVGIEVLSNSAEEQLWGGVREFSSRWMAIHPEGGVLRVSTPPADLGTAVEFCENASVSRAAIGVTYVGCADAEALTRQLGALRSKGIKTLVEHASAAIKGTVEQWADPDSSFAVMQRLKHELDPKELLNPGRLFGKI